MEPTEIFIIYTFKNFPNFFKHSSPCARKPEEEGPAAVSVQEKKNATSKTSKSLLSAELEVEAGALAIEITRRTDVVFSQALTAFLTAFDTLPES